MRSGPPIGLLWVLLAFPAGCLPTTTAGEDPALAGEGESGRVSRIPVEVATTQRRTVTEYLELTGTTQPWDEFVISPEIPGRISALEVEEGERIQAGQLLAELERGKRVLEERSRDARLQRARDELEYQHKRLARGRLLLERGAIAQAEVDALEQAVSVAESDLELTRIDLELIRQELEDTRISSPVSGQIYRRHVSLGETVSPAVPLFTLIQLDPLKVETEVTELDLGVVRVGAEVELRFKALAGEVSRGVVHRIDPVANPESGSFPVEIRIPGSASGIQPGMIASLRLPGRVFPDSLVVPLDSIQVLDDESFVFVVREGVAHRERVEIRSRIGTDALLSGGLKEGEHVVVRGVGNLTEGTPVEVSF